MFYSCSRYPDCDCAVGNPPEKDHPCPQCGSLLLRRPKSLRCWGCGAELDLDFNVTKDGDVEAETAARQAKATAKAARAAAKKPAARKSTAKKSTAKKSTAKKKKPAAKNQPAARKQPATTTTAAASIPSTEGPAEG
jgi:ssDNA-binding Zn-finger/Zn-ribbon topoisomerase 1